MLTRRRVLGYSALAPAVLAQNRFFTSPAQSQAALRLAVIGNSYVYGSNLQIMADRFLVGYPHEGDWHVPNVKIVSLYVEPKPGAAHRTAADLSAGRAKEFGIRQCRNIPDALRCGGDQLAVDAVLSVVEQGDYPRNHKGQILYPRYDFFEQCSQVFAEDKRAVPYFNHDSLSFSFHRAKSMVDASERLKFPLMAGSSLPFTWRLPETDIPLGARIQEAIMVCPFDGMEFDALEAMQCMLERRRGGETGVKAVQLLEGDDVWSAAESGRWSKAVLSSAMSRSDAPLGLTLLDGRMQDMATSGVLPQLVKDPAAYCIEYIDGTRATLLKLDGADRNFTFSASVPEHGFIATQFFRAPVPNVNYSAQLTAKIEQMFFTGAASYPVRRTLLTTGILEAAVNSRNRFNQRVETPQLAVKYQPPSESQYART
ncbi:MAG: hypothetical protein JWO80_5088 [Bryobacterales bacterium]|nr:hypothetical protein [Bryobacterales bacterium]